MDTIADVTKLYKNGEIEDKLRETMEELNIDNILTNYMEPEFNLGNSKQAFR